MISTSAGAKISGCTPPTATNPGSSPSASEIWFHRRNGDVVGSTIIRRFGSGIAKYAIQTITTRQNTMLFKVLKVE